MRSLLLSLMVVAAPALADVYESELLLKLCFAHPTYCPEGQADLIATDRVLKAPFGIRLEQGRTTTHDSTAVRLDEAFIVTDRRGIEYRVWVRDSRNHKVRVEAVPVKSQDAIIGPTGNFVHGVMEIDGQPSKVDLGRLTLHPSGRYVMKSGSGNFSVRKMIVGFDGAIEHWGAGELSDDGKKLTFQFDRGGLHWTIHFDRDPDDVVPSSFAVR